MVYMFEILGVAPVLEFFNHQQSQPTAGVTYVGSYRCTLDAVIAAIEAASHPPTWHLDAAVESVLDFWVQNADRVNYWRDRLEQSGQHSLLVSRLGDFTDLQTTFELLLDRR